ncbi:MAG: hypothetical protein R3A45_08595 [Bdellovibrionota bacterium]
MSNDTWDVLLADPHFNPKEVSMEDESLLILGNKISNLIRSTHPRQCSTVRDFIDAGIMRMDIAFEILSMKVNIDHLLRQQYYTKDELKEILKQHVEALLQSNPKNPRLHFTASTAILTLQMEDELPYNKIRRRGSKKERK